MSDTNTIPETPPGTLWGPRLVHLDGPSRPGFMCLVNEEGWVLWHSRGQWQKIVYTSNRVVFAAMSREIQAQANAHLALCAYLNNTGDAEWAAYVKACDVLRALGCPVPDMNG